MLNLKDYETIWNQESPDEFEWIGISPTWRLGGSGSFSCYRSWTGFEVIHRLWWNTSKWGNNQLPALGGWRFWPSHGCRQTFKHYRAFWAGAGTGGQRDRSRTSRLDHRKIRVGLWWEISFLTNTTTDCLAKDQCGIPAQKPKIKLGANQDCAPNSGCC